MTPITPLRGLEFRRGSRIDPRSVAATLEAGGPLDVVSFDHVSSSPGDSLAERSLLALLDMCIKPGGRVFLAGRNDDIAQTAINERVEEIAARHGWRIVFRRHLKWEWKAEAIKERQPLTPADYRAAFEFLTMAPAELDAAG